MDSLDYLVLVAYFVLMIWMGRVAMRRVKAQEDYFMGGRQFGKWLQAFAAFGAGTGSSDPVNTARTTFTSGMSGIWGTMSWLCDPFLLAHWCLVSADASHDPRGLVC
jgi:SSS family solute:Na+ symporter